MAQILLVEDEIDISNLLSSELRSEGHTVYQAFDGATALSIVEAQTLHLVILDWMLPGLDGLSVCRRIRQDHLVPIIMLTARTEEADRILGLEVGADDYVSKPFSIRELQARVRAILRRVELDRRDPLYGHHSAASNGKAPSTASPRIVHGPLSIDTEAHTAQFNGVELGLTPKEYDLLLLLASHPGRAFSRAYLLQELWGYDYDGFDRTVDTHINRLRKKLGPLGEKIVTVWGVGYRFTP